MPSEIVPFIVACGSANRATVGMDKYFMYCVYYGVLNSLASDHAWWWLTSCVSEVFCLILVCLFLNASHGLGSFCLATFY